MKSTLDQLKLAEQIARKAHKGQFRHDGKTPYITHPEKVVSLLEHREEKVLGWLHDVLENTDVTKEDLENNGIEMMYINMLDILTRHKDELYMSYIKNIGNEVVATKVKVADIVANLSDNPTKNKIKEYTEALSFLCVR